MSMKECTKKYEVQKKVRSTNYVFNLFQDLRVFRIGMFPLHAA
jgi:hypothetical protein